ncbi:DegT/DnrJ/EryC1/StrS family aminotransferase [Hylemonella gracilis]|uniref:Glutamine--scyllo-inositol transaminase n=1 Tax=Hylemonella gracilis ATCC 19624 TaxID=887062 RepID=F3KSD8_9BURK|nr:DegT/DnrJ/EryC1/StrS family aminotransferase [Hylemonella gracilis]EGI77332.1 glutamine--scyllo-inositol transaminase [Hylemonella gracilis ATCC 19624]
MTIDYENLKKANEPFFKEYMAAFQATAESGWYVLGKQVAQFEADFAQRCNRKFGIGLASGLDALYLGLLSLDLPQGSEVIVPANTYIATILAIINAGHKPVLVEPDPRTYNIDPKRILEALTKKTRAIMLVHLYGKVCDMDPILSIAKDAKLAVLEDVAQAHDARYKGRPAGSFGEAGAFSFYPTKNLGALGDAGALLVDDEALANKVRALRNYGSFKKYVNIYRGVNSRLDEVQAAFLNIKLAHLSAITLHKRALADIYDAHLSGGFIKPVRHPDFEDVFHIYNIRHPKRDALKAYLQENGIGTEIHYPIAPHKQEAMKGILDSYDGKLPITEEIHATTLSLPISFAHTTKEVERVVEVLNDWAKTKA